MGLTCILCVCNPKSCDILRSKLIIICLRLDITLMMLETGIGTRKRNANKMLHAEYVCNARERKSNTHAKAQNTSLCRKQCKCWEQRHREVTKSPPRRTVYISSISWSPCAHLHWSTCFLSSCPCPSFSRARLAVYVYPDYQLDCHPVSNP
jgi:hypothetical protein